MVGCYFRRLIIRLGRIVFLLFLFISFYGQSQNLTEIPRRIGISQIGIDFSPSGLYYISSYLDILENKKIVDKHEISEVNGGYQVVDELPDGYKYIAWYSNDELLVFCEKKKSFFKYCFSNKTLSFFRKIKKKVDLNEISYSNILFNKKNNLFFLMEENGVKIIFKDLSKRSKKIIFNKSTVSDSLKDYSIFNFSYSQENDLLSVYLRNLLNGNYILLLYDPKTNSIVDIIENEKINSSKYLRNNFQENGKLLIYTKIESDSSQVIYKYNIETRNKEIIERVDYEKDILNINYNSKKEHNLIVSLITKEEKQIAIQKVNVALNVENELKDFAMFLNSFFWGCRLYWN